MIVEEFVRFVPSVATLVLSVIVLVVLHRWFERRSAIAPGHRMRNQVVLLSLTAAAALLLVLVLPIGEATRGQLLGLIGIVASAAVALSSTNFLGNAMAGVMMRAVRNFRMGDFIRVGEHFGRVSERGLFHVEIQTADRELTTLPNLYLVANAVTTIRSSGTIISATASLGYDVSRRRIEAVLLEAAQEAGLEEPFVQILELGDFSVTYRIAGLLTEVKLLLSTRSRLRGLVMDHLHGAGIEIVSPNFMSTRALDAGRPVIPQAEEQGAEPAAASTAPETVVFDKADEAESLEALTASLASTAERIEALEKSAEDLPEGAERAAARAELEALAVHRERLEKSIAVRNANEKDG